jgi:glycosyltransferase involved in cell wall biosynthesis
VVKWPLYRMFVPRFDGYLVVGTRARQYLRHYGADPGRMFFAPHAVDNEFFATRVAALRADRAGLRAAWGIPEDATVFLFCGKIIARKRPEDFARAVAEASREMPSIWGLLAGDGALRVQVEATVREAGWPVRFSGFLNQSVLPRAYAAADALVLPSDETETWGLVVNEAMASGIPSIVSDRVGCAPDLVLPGQTGEVFPCGDVSALAARLVALARDPDHLRRLGDRARRHVAAYSMAAAVEGTVRAIDRLARGLAPVDRPREAARPRAADGRAARPFAVRRRP